LHQRSIQREDLDLVVIEPPAKSSHRALRISGSAYHIRSPGGQVDPARLYEAYHHPGESLAVATIHPSCMLAEHLNQRIIQIGRVLHGDPTLRSVLQGRILTWGKTGVNMPHFCQSIRVAAIFLDLRLQSLARDTVREEVGDNAAL